MESTYRFSTRQRFLALVMLGSVVAGCQQLGLRRGGAFVEEDEWGVSPGQMSQVPRPYMEVKRSKQRGADTANRTGLSDSESSASTPIAPTPNNTAQPTIKNVADKPQTSAEADDRQTGHALRSNSGQIADTGVEDIDLDAALAGLPPQYQDILKRQLAASKKIGLPATESSVESSVVPSSPKDTSSSVASSNKVSMRFSDDEESTTSSSPAPSAGTPVVAASANDSQVAPENVKQAQASSAQSGDVVAASATSHTSPAVGPSLPSASSPAPTLPNSNATPASQPVAANMSVAPALSPASNSHLGWYQSVAQAIQSLEKQLKDLPPADENLRLHQELTIRMLYAALRKPDEAMQPISGLSDDENEYYRNQMLALIEASNPDAMPVRSRHLSLVMDSQRKATGFLAAASNLEVRNVAFCTDVERYGVITKFPRYQFKPDEEVLLYCEVENVSAFPVKDGFESQLQGSYEILDSNGNRIVEQTLPMEPDICQNVRRDYYMVYRIFMPQQISPGNYKLRLTIEDLKARKYGQATLDLQIKK
jgi:hypothetical protein